MNNLAKYRAIHGLTQTELAEKLNTTKANVSLLETGKLSPKNAQKFAEVLGENALSILGTDNFRLLPTTNEEKEILIDIIRKI